MRGAVAIRSALPEAAQRTAPSTDCRVDHFGPTLGTNACRDILKNEEFPTD